MVETKPQYGEDGDKDEEPKVAQNQDSRQNTRGSASKGKEGPKKPNPVKREFEEDKEHAR